MPSKQLYLSMGLGVVIAIAILVFSTQLYTNIAPTTAPFIQDSDTGTLGGRLAVPETVTTRFSFVKQEASIVLIYVEYKPVAKDVGGVSFQVSSIKMVFEEEGELTVPESLVLRDTFTLAPGEKELVAAIPIYPATLTKIELSLSGSVSTAGGYEDLGAKILTWTGYIELESQKPVIIVLTIE